MMQFRQNEEKKNETNDQNYFQIFHIERAFGTLLSTQCRRNHKTRHCDDAQLGLVKRATNKQKKSTR